MKILSKKAIRELQILTKESMGTIGGKVMPCGQDVLDALNMAEWYRRKYRQKRRDDRRRPKTHLRPTDILSPEEIPRLLKWAFTRADESRSAGDKMSRAITDEMIILLLLGSGLRAEEATSLKTKDTPWYHKRNSIWVENGKGGKSRTVWISKKLAEKMIDYVDGFAEKKPTDYFFRNERGGQFSYGSLLSKIKRIGITAGVMPAGEGETHLTCHKFRHTFATLLRVATKNLPTSKETIKNQLGHSREETSNIYIHAAAEIFGCEMELFQKQLAFAGNEDFQADFIENSNKQQSDNVSQVVAGS